MILIIVLIALVGCLLLFLFLLSSGPTVIFPGTPVQKTYQQSSMDLDSPIQSKIAFSPKESPLSFTIEGLQSEPTEPGRWKLLLYFTIFNNQEYKVTVYDMHAHVYCRHAYMLAPLTIGLRYDIELLETNSILEGGKVYHIDAHGELPVALTFQITRWEGFGNEANPTPGIVLSVFGIYVDCRFNTNRVVQMRIPLDSIFCFQDANDGHFVHIDEFNISTYWQKFKYHPTNRKLILSLKKTLKKHNSQAFVLKT